MHQILWQSHMQVGPMGPLINVPLKCEEKVTEDESWPEYVSGKFQGWCYIRMLVEAGKKVPGKDSTTNTPTII